ncbi:MAG: MetQ/NlpA family ABC transporter substrate-binding protein [Coriobacteriia bacterium]|nr:MetQ/NlpA family ABC transporter substrate-binding protein [Coriobacteriia bacterium]
MKSTTKKGTTIKKLSTVLLSALLVLSLSLALAACGGGGGKGAGGNDEKTKLIVGATTVPHAEILNALVDDLAAEGFDLQVVEYTDYAKLNPDTGDGVIFANFFQHVPYLDEYNAAKGTDLVSVVAVHFEPLAIYPGKTTSLADLPDGATIALPNDTTNEARALQLLEAQGLITLPANADLTVTPRDIVNNPKNLKFVELEAAVIPVQLPDVDLGIINGNFALAAGLDSGTILAKEDPNSQAAQTYANVLVVNAGNEDDPAVKALVKALTSDKCRKFINDTYQGVVIPVF